jgi:polysaccharide biosynthesis/export protein
MGLLAMLPGNTRVTRSLVSASFVVDGLPRMMLVLMLLLAFSCMVFAQQPGGNQAPQPAVPAQVSAGQSPEQAAKPSTPNSNANAGAQKNPDDENTQNANIKDANLTPDKLPQVVLGPGDLVEVSVYNVPELTSKARVNTSGDLYLPLIDYVHVAGLTAEDAQLLIQKRLEDAGFVRNPHVTIFVDEAASQGVIVMGEVIKPGIYPDTVNHKLYGVISEAGGFSQFASHKVAIIRPSQADPIRVDIPRNLADDLTADVEVLPGDTITVPKAPIVYVVGDVGRPSGLLVDNGTLTVLQAIALAGGTNHTAKMSGVRILHKTPTGVTETRVQLKKMLEAKAPDVTLQSDDILFVPISGARVVAARSFEAAITAATAVSVYTVH